MEMQVVAEFCVGVWASIRTECNKMYEFLQTFQNKFLETVVYVTPLFLDLNFPKRQAYYTIKGLQLLMMVETLNSTNLDYQMLCY